MDAKLRSVVFNRLGKQLCEGGTCVAAPRIKLLLGRRKDREQNGYGGDAKALLQEWLAAL